MWIVRTPVDTVENEGIQAHEIPMRDIMEEVLS
jgi:hypothetical protein